MQAIAHFLSDLRVARVMDKIGMLGRIEEQVIKTLSI
jgi:hypothetical protein